jgi:preprotein translocase subunit SecA
MKSKSPETGHVHGPDCDHDHDHTQPHRRETPKLGRNDPCPCGSGKKYKKCHGARLDD